MGGIKRVVSSFCCCSFFLLAVCAALQSKRELNLMKIQVQYSKAKKNRKNIVIHFSIEFNLNFDLMKSRQPHLCTNAL